MLKKWCALLLVFLMAMGSAASAELISVTLSDEKCESVSEAVQCDGSIVTITAPGEYLITGSLSNGQVKVDCFVKKIAWNPATDAYAILTVILSVL